MIRRPPRSTLFPYPALFRSSGNRVSVRHVTNNPIRISRLRPPRYTTRPRHNTDPRIHPTSQIVLSSRPVRPAAPNHPWPVSRLEEHTSELQSPCNLVCRLLL